MGLTTREIRLIGALVRAPGGGDDRADPGPAARGRPIREIRLIEVLLRHPEGLTADDLADRLGVSARTVHRDLPPAGEFLASYDLTLVRRAGRGINVEGQASARERALEASEKMRSEALTPAERRGSLLRTPLRR